MFERVVQAPGRPGGVSGSVPGGGRFEVRDVGGQVISWTTKDGMPVIWCNPDAALGHLGDPTIVHGVPVAFPWVGKGRTGSMTPEHGLVRGVRWQLLRMFALNGVTSLVWRLSEEDIAGVEGARQWPHRFNASLVQRFGEQLEVSLSLRNTGDNFVAFEEALHFYLQVRDVGQVLLHGLAGTDFVGHRAGERDTQIGPLRFGTELRRNFHSRGDLTLYDPALKRRIRVEKERSANTLVWSPGPKAGAARPDLAGHWREFVRISVANTDRDMIHLQPGEAHTTRARISVEAA